MALPILGRGEEEIVFAAIVIALIGFVVLTVVAIKIIIICKIFSKAGYSWALGLLTLLPIINIIMFFFLAFADWPVRRELRLLKEQQNKPSL